MAMLAAVATDVRAQTAEAETPCLQALRAEQAKAPPKKKKSNTGKAVLGLLGGGAGTLIGKAVCGKGNTGCIVAAAAAGGSLGVALGKKLDEKSEKKLTEASYAAALSGQPAAVSLTNGCAIADTVTPVELEDREVVLAFAGGVARPTETLTTIAKWQAPGGTVAMSATPAPAKKGGATLPAGKPAFVMGSVADGRYLLVGREDAENGKAAAGYVPAKGWTAMEEPENPAAQTAAAGQVNTVTLKAAVPCWVTRTTLRSEGQKAQQDTTDIRYCRLPDGNTETVLASS
ncbi:hypothetical protein L6Q21_02400 [Sandaracinobacter sp. RS1-74]|uniref:hypothetical protein n=1 Tax=Sandaracinobacteroides sayramensis TaxID=2913411 RepID=UPI001EDBA66F|nr:hypothetical protein [Sandaracinobacteroides sayramensis]MCG2839833.1 hypothetical protein [Sandaracinobacteroides sayramensis]